MKSEKVICRIVPDDCNRLMTIDEAAARLQTSPQAVKKILKKRAIIPIRRGSCRYITKTALNTFIQKLEEGVYQMDELAELSAAERERA